MNKSKLSVATNFDNSLLDREGIEYSQGDLFNKQKIIEWAILSLIIATGFIYIIWFNSHLSPLPTRLPDNKIVLLQTDFDSAPTLEPYRYLDQWSYMAMAEKPFSNYERVRFCHHAWRILTPSIVHLIPLPRESAFYLLALLGILISAIFLYLFLKNLFPETGLAYYGVITFFLLPITSTTPVYLYTYLEATTLPFFFAGLYLIDRKRYIPLIICIYLGVLQREVLIFLGPTLLVHELTGARRSLRHLIRIILIYICIPLLIIGVVHAWLPTTQGFSLSFGIKYFWENFYKWNLSGNPIKVIFFLYLFCVQPWFIPGFFSTTFGLIKTLKFFASKLHYLVFVGLSYSTLIMSPNVDRCVCYAAPIIIACYLYCVTKLFESFWINRLMLIILSSFQLLWSLNGAFPYLRHYHLHVRHLLLVCALITTVTIIGSMVQRKISPACK